MAAIETMASAQPTPELKPKTTLWEKSYSRSTMNREAPRMAQFTVMRGRKMPRAL